jgi:hypothetical protein
VALEQSIGPAGDAGIKIRWHWVRSDEAVNTIGIPLVPGADDEFMRSDDRNRNIV